MMGEGVGVPVDAPPAVGAEDVGSGSRWSAPRTLEEVAAECLRLRRMTWSLHKRVCILEGVPVTKAGRRAASRQRG